MHRLDQERLVIALGVGTGRAVAGVADAVVAGQRVHGRRCEDVGHEPGVLVQPHAAAVADCNARCLLPTMLQREQPEEDGLGHTFAVRGRHAEHTALLVRRVGVRDGNWCVVRQHAREPP